MVEVAIYAGKPLESTDDTIVAFDFEGLPSVGKLFEANAAMASKLKETLLSGDFTGKDGQISLVYYSRPKRILLVGLGAKNKFHVNKVRVASAQAVNYSRQIGVSELSFISTDYAAAIAEACVLADHKFDVFKTDKPKVNLKSVKICTKEEIKDSVAVARNCCGARTLVNTPASTATPQYIAETAVELCKKLKIKCTVFEKKDLQKMGANGLLAVGSGSINEPRMVVLEYSPSNAEKSYALVGKGITFDSGGLDIKPASSMETMKHDMSGASAVLYAVASAAELKLPVKLYGVLALTENMVGPNSYKPGDIIKTMSGKTIEILNTDAEGRVVLSDALHYAKSLKTDFVIDLATLTGACIVALGKEASGIMGNDSGLIARLKTAGDRVFERAWELPMFDEYQEYVKSDFADLRNVTSNQPGSGAGAITAAKFLQSFVEGCKWAHLDIAGTAWSDSDSGYTPKGATGVGVRLLVEFLKSESS